MSASDNKIVLVTGGNKGIGFEVIRLLAAAHPSYTLLLGCRSQANGEAAIAKLPEAARKQVHLVSIDLSDPASITKAAETVKREYGRVDILFDNAAIAAFGAEHKASIDTFKTNVYGTKLVDDAFVPLIPSGGRVVIVSSEVGCWAHNEAPAALRSTIENIDTLQWSTLDTLMQQYLSSRAAPDFPGQDQFPDQVRAFGSYGTSKMFLSAYGRILARDLKEKGIIVSLTSPGYCATDLNHHSGPRSAETGAHSVVRAAEEPTLAETGKMWMDGESLPAAIPVPQEAVDNSKDLASRSAAKKE